MRSRREVVLSGLLTIIFAGASGCVSKPSAMHRHHGCILMPWQAAQLLAGRAARLASVTGTEPIIPRSRDKDFDYALAQTLSHMSETMHVLPGFAYYDDGRSMNAYATSLRRLANSDGTVLLGTNLLFSVMSELEQPDVAVTAICAHEFGHIVQFKNNLISKIGAGQKTVRHLELHADFLAGFYAGRRKLQNRHYPAAVFAMRAYQTGDYDRRNPNHHGEPSERAAAVVRGFEAAYRTRLTIAEAIRVGLDYVARI